MGRDVKGARSVSEAIDQAQGYAQLDARIREEAREYLHAHIEGFDEQPNWKQRAMVEELTRHTHGMLNG